MCLWDRSATVEEKRVSFVRALNVAVNTGQAMNAHYCDLETNYALYYVAENWPDVTPELVELAWTAFEGQFNGVNKAKAKAQWDSLIRSRYGD